MSNEQEPSIQNDCPVCGQTITKRHKHWGSTIETCTSCSSFFRRSCIEKKTYKCRQNQQNCELKKVAHKHGCQFCRFNRCLKVGMTINNVFASRVDSYISDIGDESVLNRLVACKRANFTTRIDATQHIYGSKEAYINTTNKLKTAVSFKNAFLAEKRVFNSFLNRCGILNIADDDQAFRASLTGKFFAYWMACEIGYNTVKYKGFASKKAYDIDDAYLIANEDLLMDYMGQFGYFYDPLAIKDVKMEMCTVIMEKAKRMHELRICEVEMTAVLWLLLLRAAMSIHSMPSYFKQEASKLFADLTKFYASKYENSAERIGNLMLFIDMIEDIKKVKSEVATIIELNLIPLNVILASQRRNQLTQ